ncbi:tripartite tricarboxylate transporter substrate binding protein [Halomonas sp. MCCC 1A17488]|uniref:Bug family tripartite tricarboxylate transporter substrate binding protein n=1 Tax=unclassified Halomonas TaxID=2609666 RepID=UPI001F34A8E0|nr:MULTISPECIES: tripartite tricarboxylate transporter substrate binding protein [unclassified Halomonas]MCE8016127.1 tripartite tricarboxylate transporter substrate binding protein [Halomonas sp. MCCC 1A17488]MCG3239460.1 tripartite tricarboxylate transporter substrate binding protein [Halomonas sp. MCCC 1A17488]
MKQQLLSLSLVAFASTSLLVGASLAQADYPEKTINLVVGYSAGGGTDVMARTVAKYVEEQLGEGATVVVKNMPGAGGQIGFSAIASAEPDGYTIGTMNLPAAMALTYDRDADYDVDSFTWLANVVSDPNTLVVPKGSDIHSLEELIEHARNAPGKIPVGLSSLGGNDHFSAIQFAEAADVELNYVPFNGAAHARSALMGGHVAMGTMAFSQTVGFEEELRVLAVLSDERLPQAPDVPTAKELGFDIEMGSFRGLAAPAGLPDDIRADLVSALESMATDPAFLSDMARQGNPLSFSYGDDYKALAEAQDEAARRTWEETPWK